MKQDGQWEDELVNVGYSGRKPFSCFKKFENGTETQRWAGHGLDKCVFMCNHWAILVEAHPEHLQLEFQQNAATQSFRTKVVNTRACRDFQISICIGLLHKIHIKYIKFFSCSV